MLQNIRMPAELREETMNLFMNTNGPESCTAYEVYCGICESLYLAESKHMGTGAMLMLEEEVSRCLTMRYTAFDVPGRLERKLAKKERAKAA